LEIQNGNPGSEDRRFVSIDVLKQALPRTLITHYWILLLVSLLAFVHSVGLNVIELSFYLPYFVVGGLVKSLFQRKIGDALEDLHQSGALPDKEYPLLAAEFERRLNHRLAVHVCGAAVASVLVALFFVNFLSTRNDPFWWVPVDTIVPRWCYLIIDDAIDVFFGYAGGVAIWKIMVLAYQMRAWSLSERFYVRPFHPDGAAGLGAVGRLFLFVSFILISVGIFASGWILYAHLINRDFRGDPTYRLFEPLFEASLIILFLLSALTFFMPMKIIHKLMVEHARRTEAKLAALAGALAESEESLLSRSVHMTRDEVESESARVQALRDVYSHRPRIPTWPIDVPTFTKFVGAQIPGLIAFASSIASLAQKSSEIGAVIKHLF
jgi:hypothetical protein